MTSKLIFHDCCSSRHPKIQYWFWDKELVEKKDFSHQLDLLAEYSDFNTVIITERDGINLYEKNLLPAFSEVVSYAHAKGLKIYLQLWPNGQAHPIKVDKGDAIAYISEHEGAVTNGTVSFTHACTHISNKEVNPHIANCLISAHAFQKMQDGVYAPNTCLDVTQRAIVRNEGETCSVSFSLPELEGYTVYTMVAHYYSYADLFAERMIDDFRDVMDYYRSAGFDGFVLDEMRNLATIPPWRNSTPCERSYGDHFKRYFHEKTGKSLDKTLFEMRYCAKDDEQAKIKAINLYFDLYRHSARRAEDFVAAYNIKHFGDSAFLGLHNTFHNSLHSDEIFMTGCNWWEVPRKYAQTDEDIAFPVRMGLACQAEESLCIDMYYDTTEAAFAEKVMRDAPFGCRTHYHAMNDNRYGINTGTKEFLTNIRAYEQKITLLNAFDPAALPKMELLVVFGFPALCNWYPHKENKTNYELNGALDIQKRANRLWNAGYLNALAPSDAIDDGRITLDADGRFDYCGHKFEKLLYLYPQYAKPVTVEKLRSFLKQNADLRILGRIDRDFFGAAVDSRDFEAVTLEETADIPASLQLSANPIENGCVLADGTVVISSYDSVKNNASENISLEINGHVFEAEYQGVFAVKADESGKIVKIACGGCKSLRRDGRTLFADEAGQDILVSES